MFPYAMRPSRITRSPRRPPAPRPGPGTRRDSPSADLVVEAVALHRGPARVADDAYELPDLLLGAGARARGLEDLLPHHRALHVVGAEMESHLGEREAHHDPVGLHMRDVVEQEPRYRDHLEVVRAGGE